MEENRERLPEKELNPGRQWAQRLGVGGGITVLLFSLACVLTLLTSGPKKLDYAPAHTDAYYAEHVEVLQQELTEHVFPQVEGIRDCEIEDGKLVIGIRSKYYIETRAIIIDLFDRDLFVFEER